MKKPQCDYCAIMSKKKKRKKAHICKIEHSKLLKALADFHNIHMTSWLGKKYGTRKGG